MPPPNKVTKLKTTSAPALLKKRAAVSSVATARSDKTLSSTGKKAAIDDGLMSRREMLFIVMRLEEMKKKNERLHTEQEMKYGITIDNLKDMQKDIDHAKSINNSLLQELELRRARYDRLEADMVELKKRFEECQTELKVLKREQKTWKETDKKLAETENRYRALIKTNKALRALLMKHSIDPGSVTSVPSTPTGANIRKDEARLRPGKPKQLSWK